MTNEAKMMLNMAMSIASLNDVVIVRMDLQRHEFKSSPDLNPWYHLDVWFSDGKEITIREDCTIYEH